MLHTYDGDVIKVRNSISMVGPLSSRPRITFGIGIALILCVSLVGIPTTHSAQEMVRVKVKSANLRDGPGKNFTKVHKVPRNYPYQVITRKGRWLKVKDFEGYEDWIYGPLTDRAPAAVIKVKLANVRSGPGTQNPVVFTADKGVPFQVLEKKGNWIKVRANDQDEGWIHKTLLWGFFKDPKGIVRKKGTRPTAKKADQPIKKRDNAGQ
jgi:SH3-like domain-containing protein